MFFEELIPNINIETNTIEFKGLIEEGKDKNGNQKELSWLSVLASFSNTINGDMYIGVDNTTHKILSLDHTLADKTILMIHRLIKERIYPRISYNVDAIPIKEKDDILTRYIIKVSVLKNAELPVFVKVGGLLGIYIRDFGLTREATPQEIANLVLSSKERSYDIDLTDIKFNFDDYKKLSSLYFDRTSKNLTKKDLISCQAIDENDYVTKGLLLFSDSFKSNELLTICNLWPNNDKATNRIINTEEFKGNIIDSIFFAINYIKSHSSNGYEKTTTGRIDYVSYPERSVFEGVVNAYVHKNYLLSYTSIEINMYLDRLEITSPGSLIGYGTIVKEKNIASILPKARNEVIASILRLLKMMEKRGTGFDLISNEYLGYGDKYTPFISCRSDSFTLTLPNLTYTGLIEENEFPDIYTDKITLGKHDLKILSYCYNSPKTITEIANMLNIKASTYLRKEIIMNLVNENYLIEGINDGINSYSTNHRKVFVK